jgi:hypothetical protein
MMESRLGYVLGALCLIAGVALAGWLVWGEIAALQHAFTRVVVPGTAELTLGDAGSYTIFIEPQSVVDGRLYSVQNIGGMTVSITSEADGKPVAVTVPQVTSSYTIGGHKGTSVFGFEIAQPGRYRLTGSYAGGANGPQMVLAISQGFMWALARTILGALGASLAGFLGCAALVLTTYFRRRRMLRPHAA